jgi:hypothetical protein
MIVDYSGGGGYLWRKRKTGLARVKNIAAQVNFDDWQITGNLGTEHTMDIPLLCNSPQKCSFSKRDRSRLAIDPASTGC